MRDKHLVDDKYQELTRILSDAMEQATGGKGKERHADGEAFEDQKICVINRWLRGSPVAGPLFQAVKKAVESSRLVPHAAIRELYGSINYISAAIRLLEEEIDIIATTEAANAEIRRIEQQKFVKWQDRIVSGPTRTWFLPGGEPVTDVPEALAHFSTEVVTSEGFTCEQCFYRNLAPNDMPCKKCIDKPHRPHFTKSNPTYAKPPMPV